MAGLRLPDGRQLGFAEYGDRGGVPCFYFHATPGSRLDPAVLFARSPVTLKGIRLVAVDRLGFGLSDRQPGREFGDFPADVAAVADHLGIDRFAVVGLSGGGGYALACAYAIPGRLSVAVVVSGMTPVSQPEERRGLAVGNRVVYRLAGSAPRLAQAIMALLFRMTILALKRSERSPRGAMGLPFAPEVLADPRLRPLVIAGLNEAVIRPGARGLVDELALYGRRWDIRLEGIETAVCLWHGDSDVNAPTARARAVAAAIPRCRAVFVAGGHTAPLACLDDIFEPVRATMGRAPDRRAHR